MMIAIQRAISTSAMLRQSISVSPRFGSQARDRNGTDDAVKRGMHLSFAGVSAS